MGMGGNGNGFMGMGGNGNRNSRSRTPLIQTYKARTFDNYDCHEREDVVLEVVSVISAHFDVDGDQSLDMSLCRV